MLDVFAYVWSIKWIPNPYLETSELHKFRRYFFDRIYTFRIVYTNLPIFFINSLVLVQCMVESLVENTAPTQITQFIYLSMQNLVKPPVFCKCFNHSHISRKSIYIQKKKIFHSPVYRKWAHFSAIDDVKNWFLKSFVSYKVGGMS